MPPVRRCVVVGAGLLGLSAAWSLSRRGWAVEVFEAADGVGNPRAGSKGDARIFRLGYPDAHYVAMARAARTLWRRLEEQSGRHLLRVTGQLSFGDPETLAALADALIRHGEDVESLTRQAAEARFVDITLPGAALYEPGSGVLAADECLRALCDSGGFELRARTDVRRLEDHGVGGGVTVHCADGRLVRTDVVVDCAGPGALRLLGDGTPAVGKPPSLPQVAYFAAAESGTVDPERLPVFIEWGDAMVYGLPVLGPGPHAGLYKVSHHTPGPPLRTYEPASAPTPDLESVDAAHVGTLCDAVRRLLPGLDPEPVATERCIYDNSADTDFVLDRVGNIVVGCGTSGHGFKFGPLLGELLADLAEGTAPPLDLEPFRIDRHDSPGRSNPQNQLDQEGSSTAH